MNTNSYDDVLDHELTQLLVREAIVLAMESPLREPILQGVEGSTASEDADAGDGRTDEAPEEAGSRSLVRTGIVVLAVLGVLAYALRGYGFGE